MYPASWSFVAVLLLLVGIREEWLAPRRRIARVLHTTDALRDTKAQSLEQGPLRWVLTWLADRIKPWMPGSQLAELREQLLWAGQPFGMTVEEFFFAKFGVAFTVALTVPLLGLGGENNGIGFMLAAGAVGYILPERLLAHRVAERTRQIRRDLPNFVNLLATAMESGLPIVEAVRRVALEAPGLLSAEMLRTVQEMAAGKSATSAWQQLSRRTNCRELQSVVTAIIQCQEFGVAVAEQLRFQMSTIRKQKQAEASEKSQAAAVAMRIPTIVLILMPTMIILLGPAVLSVTRAMRGV